MSVHALQSEAGQRGNRMLRTALGSSIQAWLDDPQVIEVMLNPDGRLWVDRLGVGIADTGERLSPADGERIVRLVAHHVGVEVHARRPRVSAELPETGERFEGLLPPVVAAPAFAIRKPAVAVFTLDDYAAVGIMSRAQAEMLRDAVARRANILVVGGTGTGKTTFLNVLLAELAALCPQDRIGILEDTPELAPCSPDTFRLRTVEGLDLHRLVKESLRTSPTRLVVGEVRDQAALALLDAWNTGHPGGLATLHANGSHEALVRLSTLIQRAGVPPQPELIVATVSLLVHLVGTSRATRRVAEIARVTGFNPTTDRFQVQTLYERNDR